MLTIVASIALAQPITCDADHAPVSVSVKFNTWKLFWHNMLSKNDPPTVYVRTHGQDTETTVSPTQPFNGCLYLDELPMKEGREILIGLTLPWGRKFPNSWSMALNPKSRHIRICEGGHGCADSDRLWDTEQPFVIDPVPGVTITIRPVS